MPTAASRLDQAELANLLGELGAARNPAWIEQDNSDVSAPVEGTRGVSLLNGSDGGALHAALQVRVRRVAAYRTAVYAITVEDSDTYTVGFAFGAGTTSVNYVSDASATAQEIAEGLKAAIEADGTLNAALDAYAEVDPDSGEYRLRVTGKNSIASDSADFEIISASSSGAGDLTVSADPVSCDILLWGLPGGVLATTAQPAAANAYQSFDGTNEEASPWLLAAFQPLTSPPGLAPGGSWLVGQYGLVDILQVPGLSRIFVQIEATSGATNDMGGITYFTPRIFIGPCFRESSRPLGS